MSFELKSGSTLRTIDRQLGRAGSHAEWLALAEQHDRLSGAAEWRDDEHSDLLHVAEIRRSIDALRALRLAGDPWALFSKVQELLFRHQGEFTHPELYSVAKTGTKRVVTAFLDEVEAAVRDLVAVDAKVASDAYKLEQIKQVGRVYGRPALLLSGGGTLGIYHFGVVKALFEQNLLPRSISGSSMGAIIAAWACCHDDDELRALFAEPQRISLDALHRLPAKRMRAEQALLDQAWLLNFLKTILPDMSFAESMRHSRRILNVSVSPHNVRQSARLLNYLASPDALVQHAVLASCAIPGMFRPVQLMTRKRGEIVPWMEHELWVDGSMNNDLPFAQLAQLLYINHFITSQANPHVIPFLSLHGGRHDVVASVAQMSGNLLMGGATQVLDVARKHAPTRALREVSSTAHAMSSQRYVGADMHIQIPFKPLLMARLLKNPSFEQFKEYIRLGEQATWPRLPMIRDRTRISRVFGDCIGLLMRRIAAAAPLPSQTPPRVRRRPRSPARPGSGS